MELLEVLDFNGDKTGKVLDKGLIHKMGLYHREVALILLNNYGQILLQRRAINKKIEPNKWAWHGGHVIAGESCIDAIIRETEEELGITISKDKIHFLIELKRDKIPNRQFTTAYYSICDLSIDDFNIQKEELSEIKWFSFNEFRSMIYNNHPDMMFKNNKNTNKIISALKNIITIY